MQTFLRAVDGYKSYFFGLCGIVFSILNAIYKWFPQDLGIEILMASFGLIGIKSALSKLE